MAANVLRSDNERPSRRMIRIGPNAEPAADHANKTLEKMSARQTKARIVASTKTPTTYVRMPLNPVFCRCEARCQS